MRNSVVLRDLNIDRFSFATYEPCNQDRCVLQLKFKRWREMSIRIICRGSIHVALKFLDSIPVEPEASWLAAEIPLDKNL